MHFIIIIKLPKLKLKYIYDSKIIVNILTVALRQFNFRHFGHENILQNKFIFVQWCLEAMMQMLLVRVTSLLLLEEEVLERVP